MNVETPLRSARAERERSCAQCGQPLTGKHSHARYCGATCRKRASRKAAVNAGESVTRPTPPQGDGESHVTLSGVSQGPSRPFYGLLAPLDGEAPAYIESFYTGRVFPRTYAEHGLPTPDYLRVRAS